LRIVIDCSALLLRSAGVKSYIYHWLNALRCETDSETIRAFPFLGQLGALDHERSVLPFWQTAPRLAAVHLARLGFQPLFAHITRGADIFHVSNLVRTRPRNVLVTATVYDMTCWLMPELHTPGNVAADRLFGQNVLEAADGIITVSENTRRDLIRILAVDPDLVYTIWSGVPDAYFRAEARPSEKPYLLFVGAIEPRKNVAALLDAWEGLKPSLRTEFDLVIAGAAGWKSEAVMRRLTSGIPGVRFVGYVREEEMPSLTAGALALVYPSLYEGFGLPVAQAMAAGVPVITSDVSSLPEIAGDAALLVDPRSVAEIRAAMETMLTSPTLRERLSQNARRRAVAFRWDRAARQSLEFFEAVGG
jgi:glycosyltransferase involved in cell wall biosynthesis